MPRIHPSFRCFRYSCCALLAAMIPAVARAQCTPAWIPGIGTPGTSSDVYALATLPGGDILVGGAFGSAGGQTGMNRISRYTTAGGIWSSLGVGVNSGMWVFAIAPILGGTEVIIGGDFFQAGGQSSPYIARHNLSTGTWSNMGGGAGGIVSSLVALPSGEVAVGGLFTTVGPNVSASCIAKYNPATNTWSALGAGTSNVFCLCNLPNNELLVGGSFSQAGGIEAFNIARVNTTTGLWSNLGDGVIGSVNAVALLPGGDYLVAGTITQAGSTAVANIARYNPTTGVWSALGAGVTGGAVQTLLVLPSGDVLVGGHFTMAGGQSRPRLTRYLPATNSWTGVLSPPATGVMALALSIEGDAIVGGLFTSPGSRLARYYPGPQPPTILGNPLEVNTAAGGTARFGVTAMGSTGTGTPTYLWHRNGVALDTVANPTAAAATLVLSNVQPGNTGSYTCRVTNFCGGLSTTSAAASLSLINCAIICPADYNRNGVVEVQDIFDFLNGWLVGC